LLSVVIWTIYEESRPAAMKGNPMSSDKAPNKHSGAPAAKKPTESEAFDLFSTFRHPPKPAEPARPQKGETKPKGQSS
jgi:hypothetical protein